jgi:hypothetical protein
MESSLGRRVLVSSGVGTFVDNWRDHFLDAVMSDEFAPELKASSLDGRLMDWTRVLTKAVVGTCRTQDLAVAARRHRLDRMPEAREEYLGIDAMAFADAQGPWLFPFAAIELENSLRANRVAYSLWKILNVQAAVGVVFCYRPSADAGAALIRYLAKTVVRSMSLDRRAALRGETVITVGHRILAETFPYGFFKWWRLNANVGEFEQF